jgi:hypothetical protein
MKQTSAAQWITAMLFATAALVMSGCEATESGASKEPHALIGPFRSFQAPSDVADLLRQRDLTWTVAEEDSLPEGDPRPEFSSVRWQVDSFSEQDLSGEAAFVFFNDRLAEVVVFPEDPSTLPSEEEAEKATTDAVSVRVDRDFHGKRYISYEDSRLREEKETWLSQHS